MMDWTEKHFKFSIGMALCFLIVFSIMAYGLHACQNTDQENIKVIEKPHGFKAETIDNGFTSKVIMITIDGCEYIVVFGEQCCSMVHKANCPNPIHYKETSK